MKKLLTICALWMTATSLGCSKGDKPTAQATIKPPVAVEVATAATADLEEGVEVTGNLEPKFYAEVKTQIPGLVKQVYVTEWVRVKKGAPLASIDVAETEATVKRTEAAIKSANAGLAQTEVAAKRADRELTRVQKLKEAGLATQQAVDDAETEAATAAARIEASRAGIRVAEEEHRQAKVRRAKSLVFSPINGVVALRDVNVGDLASDAAAAKPIFKIVDNRLLNLTFTVPSSEMARLKVGQKLLFTTDGIPGKTFEGKIMFVNPEIQTADRSLRVIAEVVNEPEVLKGGLFAKGRIICGVRKNVLQIPRSALSGLDMTAKKATIFVVEKDIARRRQLAIGTISGDMVEITAGLKPGELYVTRGGFNLKDADKVAMAKAGEKKP
ncbi:efflux RND transporter periplasmic adaptor subunit [Geotalea sp. SG265]|uniref:efflux RND transporter periplasmic adaptor subunit n=1 Tax=Geotalea sp. SG265 TaxID=2922867 RepID=UPI001FAEB62D|nr:efflux RND transporter periplasmic adaptor subunit [Geotalea sp. SG265]